MTELTNKTTLLTNSQTGFGWFYKIDIYHCLNTFSFMFVWCCSLIWTLINKTRVILNQLCRFFSLHIYDLSSILLKVTDILLWIILLNNIWCFILLPCAFCALFLLWPHNNNDVWKPFVYLLLSRLYKSVYMLYSVGGRFTYNHNNITVKLISFCAHQGYDDVLIGVGCIAWAVTKYLFEGRMWSK